MNGYFGEDQLTSSPYDLFRLWWEIAKEHSQQNDFDAACLSTIDNNGFPDGRMVLLRGFDDRGFVFFTNSQSTKGRSLAAIPRAALTIYWDRLKRQIRIQGDVSPVSDEDSERYFALRPRGSQLGAWASQQSAVLDSRQTLDQKVQELESRFKDCPVPRPPHWHGYMIWPNRIEFWQEGESRLHDRFVYARSENSWKVNRLYP